MADMSGDRAAERDFLVGAILDQLESKPLPSQAVEFLCDTVASHTGTMLHDSQYIRELTVILLATLASAEVKTLASIAAALHCSKSLLVDSFFEQGTIG